jgi:hypothetical protein
MKITLISNNLVINLITYAQCLNSFIQFLLTSPFIRLILQENDEKEILDGFPTF